MIKTALLSTLCILLSPIMATPGTPTPNPYTVTWDEPGKSADDSVPLGNGEIGLNAWITPKGELEFFISRTDAWDEWGRQVKVGGIRIDLDKTGAGLPDNAPFTQTLDTRTGQLTAQIGEQGKSIRIRLWVDAHRPVVVAEIESDASVSPKVLSNLWRLPGNLSLEVTGDVSPGMLTMQSKYEITPDTRLTATQRKAGQIGWYHLNGEKPAYAEVAKTQGSDEMRKDNPLKDRIFGAIVSAANARAADDATLQLAPGKKHAVEIAVETLNPSTPDKWLTHTQKVLNQAQQIKLDKRRMDNTAYWNGLQEKSHIRLTKADKAPEVPTSGNNNLFYHSGKNPLSIGLDSGGGSGFLGSISDVTLTQTGGKVLFEGKNVSPQHLKDSESWTFPKGGQFDVTFTLSPSHDGYRRILDKVTPGGSDGFLLDITPDRQLRFISGSSTHTYPGVIQPSAPARVSLTFRPSGQVKLICNDKVLLDESSMEEENAFLVTQAYALQRYVSACGGRGNLPITFNGSLFTVPMEGRPENADYRRWGSGYWWQNTRLPYYSMCMAGDFDMLLPLFKMYSDMLPVCRYRTKTHLNCDGAYFAECMYFWGDIFPRTYGTTYYKDKKDKLQDSGYHKYEWDSGIELSNLALDYYAYTQDDKHLKEKAIPLSDALIQFFNTYYKSDANGQLHMNPSQALETWWDCTNPASEVAGLLALTRKLLALPHNLTTAEQRTCWQNFQKKLPPLPVDTTKDGERKLSPATVYKAKGNIEVPELYSVFPYRICSFDQPELLQEAKNALKYRQDRGPFGWRQEDLFMTYLGETAQAKDYLLQRVKNRQGAWNASMPNLKFPGFWGPNYDWLPDQCHGGVIAATVQSMVMQASGKKILLFPAFPLEWNADFKLHAPYKTIVEGTMKDGKIVNLKVTPESRRKDVVICGGVKE